MSCKKGPDHTGITFWLMVIILGILFGREPDIVDAIIAYMGKQ